MPEKAETNGLTLETGDYSRGCKQPVPVSYRF